MSSPAKTSAAAVVSPKPHMRGNKDNKSVDEGINKDFPVLGLLPKQETQAWEFVTETHREYDGRGVKVAIFDTGVDPAASGLQECPDGRPKILDIVDCTGSGDVDTSHIIKGDAVETVDGIAQLTGLSGRILRLNPEWTNPSGEWRVGIKRAYELFPKQLVMRVKTERRKEWDKKHLAAEAAAIRELSAWKTSHPNPNPADKKFSQDLEARVAYLEECKADVDDPGPLHDCIVWRGGIGGGCGDKGREEEVKEKERWWAAVDTAEDGDLSEAIAMTDFDELRQHGRFNDVACLNFGVHIYEGGNVLSIVVDAGAHGTHVAGIVAAYYPDDPEANGVAPGAQIVSLKIGDSRLGSMETGVGIVRAVTEAVKMGCDVINMSYGEAAALCNSGRVSDVVRDAALKHGIVFVASAMNAGPALSTVQAPGGTSPGLLGVGAYAVVDVAREAVCKHRTVFVASAGNNGPGLTTSGAPGGTTPDILSVGAYASPSLMSASFSLRESLDGRNFTWTSAGPTADGDTGVSVMAPGGAISAVPNWTLQKKQLMMGTSMASPNCAGVVALLLSGMKQRFPEAKMSVHRIRRALENTAKPLHELETLVQGQGLVQVSSAFDYLVKYAEDSTEDIQYQVTANDKRGVYLRQSEEVSKKSQWTVTVKPLLHEDEHNDKRTEFEMRLRLSCKGDWVDCCSDLALLHSGRNFVIAVDPTQLHPGCHYTCIEGYDLAAPGKGPMFRLPVTAMIPTMPAYHTVPRGGLTANIISRASDVRGSSFGPGKVVRKFLHPPHGATWMDVEVKDCRAAANTSDGTRRMMVLHCLQLLPHIPYRDAECQKYLNMHPGQREVYSMRLEPCAGVEISLAQNWNSIGDQEAEVNVTFRGVSPSPDVVVLHGGCSHTQVMVSSSLGLQELSPSASLNRWWTKVSPSKSTITALGERDIGPDGRQSFSLLLEYSFKQTEAGEVTPRLAALNNYLYDSEYEAQMSMIFDHNKKLLGIGDCWPDAVKCIKGDHTVRVQVRHPQQAMLKKLKGLTLHLMRKLSKEIALSHYPSMMALSTSTKGPAVFTVDRGQSASFFFAEPPLEKLPKAVKPGDIFSGTAYFVRNKSTGGGEGRRPGGYQVHYTAGPAKPADAPQDSGASSSGGSAGGANGGGQAATGEAAAPKTESENMLDALRDFRVKHLENSQAKTAAAFEELYVTVREQIRADGRTDPDSYLPLLLARLHFLDRETMRRGPQSQSSSPSSSSSPPPPPPPPTTTTTISPSSSLSGDPGKAAAAVAAKSTATPAGDVRKPGLLSSGTKDATPLVPTGIENTPTTPAAVSEEGKEGMEGEKVKRTTGEVGATVGAAVAGENKAAATPATPAALALDPVLVALWAVVGAANDVVAKIDEAGVASHFGTNIDPEDATMVLIRKDFDEKKKALADAFARKARALAEMENIVGVPGVTKATSPFLAAYSDLLRWADVSEDKLPKVALLFLHRKKRLGMMVKLLNKIMASSSNGKAMSKEEAFTIRAKVFEELGWDHLVEGENKWAVIGHPKAFPLF